MTKRLILILLILISAVFLSGCKTTLLVHNANTKKIIPVFIDYVGMQGYSITYKNDITGSYHVDMGSVIVAGVESGSRTKSTIVVPSSSPNQPLTAYEETSWNSLSLPSHYAQATASVSIIQQGEDVLISIDTSDSGGPSLNDIKDYLQSLGYAVDNK